MTLHRRLLIAVLSLILFLLATNLVITVHNARLNIYEQLKVHAQDTATSLGFSLSQAVLDKDNVQIGLMIDAIFDRGYYRRITFTNTEGQEQLTRELSLATVDIPDWFIHWLPLPEPKGTALVASGWFQLGSIEVVSHPGFAYRDLWRSFKEQVWLFAATAVLCYGLLGIGLRYVLQPLRQVEDQAAAICQREFPIQEPLPAIPELRSVVVAMNRMVHKVKEMFKHHVELNERLYEQLNTDSVTALANRQSFDKRFSSYIVSEKAAASGTLMLVQAGDLQAMNVKSGRQQGDDYLRSVAGCLRENLHDFDGVILSRHAGADFAIFVPAIAELESQELMDKLYSSLQELDWTSDELQSIYVGALFIPQLHDSANFMALADTALSHAQNEQQSGCYWHKVDKKEKSLSAHEWSSLITQGIAEKSISFFFQPVWKRIHGENSLLFNEVMARMTVNGKEYPAGFFMPMATRLQLLPAIDCLVLEHIVATQDTLPEKLCINLSVASIDDPHFLQQLNTFFKQSPVLASRITFELPANALSFAKQSVRSFAQLVKTNGAGLSLHHFGKGSAEFDYLQTLPLNYLKIDRCFIQNIEEDADTRFFIRSLVGIAKSCDVTILAEGVETQAQWKALTDLGVQGGQGYWLGKPSAEPVVA